jgi:hypothetical protein
MISDWRLGIGVARERGGGEGSGATFFGGTMATADLGVTEMCCSFESFLSPLMERRRACVRWC